MQNKKTFKHAFIPQMGFDNETASLGSPELYAFSNTVFSLWIHRILSHKECTEVRRNSRLNQFVTISLALHLQHKPHVV